MDDVLTYSPKRANPFLKALVVQVIRALLECHRAGIVHNFGLLDSVVIPTKLLETGQGLPMIDMTCLSDLRLHSFWYAFTTQDHGKYPYSQLKEKKRYYPLHPPQKS